MFQVPSDRVYDIVASKSVISNENVNHHMTMYGCDGDIPDDDMVCMFIYSLLTIQNTKTHHSTVKVFASSSFGTTIFVVSMLKLDLYCRIQFFGFFSHVIRLIPGTDSGSCIEIVVVFLF